MIDFVREARRRTHRGATDSHAEIYDKKAYSIGWALCTLFSRTGGFIPVGGAENCGNHREGKLEPPCDIGLLPIVRSPKGRRR